MGYPAVTQQLTNLKHLSDRLEGQKLGVYHDYAREVKGLSSLPTLKHLLDQIDGKKGRVVIDDYRRIFARCPQKLRFDLLAELEQFGWHFLDLKLRAHIGELSQLQKMTLLTASSPIKFELKPVPRAERPLEERQRQTRKAAAVSRIIRTKNADSKARELAELKESLKKGGRSTSAKALAAHANEQGIKTTRGGEWSASSVRRVLKRIEESTK
ncbi:recombinase family protein [Aliiroseovarius sediminis]|uniref:recombinase family protein n=1 Tax=Aliiroseovarius sediminis TaxID=2925839 RepID=UPI001F560A61|nr:recombinase family protein [uncultured Aliiroseovarius sp.]MCI2395073.1 recombinase family protein [Aliiroseovarius sediminis]